MIYLPLQTIYSYGRYGTHMFYDHLQKLWYKTPSIISVCDMYTAGVEMPSCEIRLTTPWKTETELRKYMRKKGVLNPLPARIVHASGLTVCGVLVDENKVRMTRIASPVNDSKTFASLKFDPDIHVCHGWNNEIKVKNIPITVNSLSAYYRMPNNTQEQIFLGPHGELSGSTGREEPDARLEYLSILYLYRYRWDMSPNVGIVYGNYVYDAWTKSLQQIEDVQCTFRMRPETLTGNKVRILHSANPYEPEPKDRVGMSVQNVIKIVDKMLRWWSVLV